MIRNAPSVPSEDTAPATEWRDAAGFIDAQGGPAAVAGKLSKSPGSVRVWRHRNSFPRDNWPELQLAYPDDLPLAVLIRLEAESKGRAAGSTESVP